MASLLFLASSFIFFFFFSFSSALPRQTIFEAADILYYSGFDSMSLTLEIAESLLEHSPSTTIFAPSDSAFKKSGQPSLDLLLFHFVMLPLPQQSLRRLPAGTKLPTMLTGQSLTVTTSSSDRVTSVNNIKIIGSPIYDNGVLFVYGIDRFLDPSFQYTGPNKKPSSNSNSSFEQALETLKTTGYSETGMNLIGDFEDHHWLFRRDVVPYKFIWNDVVQNNVVQDNASVVVDVFSDEDQNLFDPGEL